MSSEANVIAEFDHRLRSAIEEQSRYYSTDFTGVSREEYIDSASGYADLVLETEGGEPFLVIEAKKEPEDEPDRSIDPYSQQVISQAANYAFHLGAEYFATYNRNRLVLFRTMERGTNLLDRKTRAYEITDLKSFLPGFLEDLAGLDADAVEWDPHQEAFVKRLTTFHDLIDQEFKTILEEKLEEESFKNRYEEWIENQGWQNTYEEDPEEVHSTYTSQAAYLFMNKLVFYKLLENASAYVNVPQIDLEQLVDAETRRETFNELMERVDFEAVYEQDPIFDSLRLTERAQREVSGLLADLEDYNLDQFDHDVIGQIYEEIIPPGERHKLGQYYTPKEIVELIVRMTVESEDDTVLDPGCGSGGFLVGGYNRLRSLSDEKGHEDILNQIYGIDINRFPAHLCAINLALRDLSTETHDAHVLVDDFFNIYESQGRVISAQRAGVGESNREDNRKAQNEYGVDIPSTIDAVIANPPYIRNENIGDPGKARAHLDEIGVDLSERSDIYCYFFTHAYQFLREGDENHRPGRMGFLTSNRWLMVGYGEDLQEFFLDNTKIKAVIDFSTQQFEVPLISTTVTILERCDNSEERNENITNFLRVKGELGPEEIVDILQDEHEPGTLYDDEEGRYRRVTFKQGSLRELDRWDRYLYAPGMYWDILDHEQICQLEEIADVRFGTKTGNNGYFYFQSEEEFEELGLDDRFVTPILKHIAQTEYIKLTREDPAWYVLDLNDHVTEILDQTENTILEQRTDEEILREEFENRGWDALIQYLDHGEEQEVDQGTSVQNIGRVWFDIGNLPIPQIILPKEYWRDSRVLWNEADIPLDQRNYEVNVENSDVDPLVLLGIMNSSVFSLMREIEGREEQGQGMNRNELTVKEAAELHIPDPRTFSDSQQEEVREVMQEWMDREREISADGEEIGDWNNPEEIEYSTAEYQERLDRAILRSLGMEDRLDAVQDAVDDMLNARVVGAGESTAVLVTTSDDETGRNIEIPGARRLDDERGQSNLDSF